MGCEIDSYTSSSSRVAIDNDREWFMTKIEDAEMLHYQCVSEDAYQFFDI